jgi:PPOX class probable F420-dependent enzyme
LHSAALVRMINSMALEIRPDASRFINEHRVARLATSDADGQPALIPICYVFTGGHLYTPIDEKPKQTGVRQLKRLRNIEVNPQVAVLFDDYGEDWDKLAYLLISGLAVVVSPPSDEHSRAVALLREKYPQYLSMAIDERLMIRISPMRIKYWRADETLPDPHSLDE